MPRPRNITDEQIVEAARACFLELGPAVATTLIAERLGISHGVLFQRFSTKEQLMRAALLPQGEPAWLSMARAGPAKNVDARQQLWKLADAIAAYLAWLMPGLAVLRSACVPFPAGELSEELPPVRARREVAGWFDRGVEQGMFRRVHAEDIADMFLGALQFRPFHAHLSSQRFEVKDHADYVEFVVDGLWRILSPEPGGPRSDPIAK